MWGSLVEMVRKMEPFWSRILEWFDAQARLQCSLHRAANPSKPVRLWSENKSRMMHWYNPTLKRSRGGFVATTHFWWQKNHQQFEQLWNVLWNFEFFRPRCFPARPVRQCYNLEFDNSRRSGCKARKGLGLSTVKVLQKKTCWNERKNPVMRMGKTPKKPNLVAFL